MATFLWWRVAIFFAKFRKKLYICKDSLGGEATEEINIMVY